MPRIAERIGGAPRALYARLDRVMRRLRDHLEVSGVTAQLVAERLAGSAFEASTLPL